MLTPPTHYQLVPTGWPKRCAFVRRLNMNSLALVLFMAVAVLSTTRSKEFGNTRSVYTSDTAAELFITSCDNSVQQSEKCVLTPVIGKNPGNKMHPNR
jgi:hypothetical protein